MLTLVSGERWGHPARGDTAGDPAVSRRRCPRTRASCHPSGCASGTGRTRSGDCCWARPASGSWAGTAATRPARDSSWALAMPAVALTRLCQCQVPSLSIPGTACPIPGVPCSSQVSPAPSPVSPVHPRYPLSYPCHIPVPPVPSSPIPDASLVPFVPCCHSPAPSQLSPVPSQVSPAHPRRPLPDPCLSLSPTDELLSLPISFSHWKRCCSFFLATAPARMAQVSPPGHLAPALAPLGTGTAWSCASVSPRALCSPQVLLSYLRNNRAKDKVGTGMGPPEATRAASAICPHLLLLPTRTRKTRRMRRRRWKRGTGGANSTHPWRRRTPNLHGEPTGTD